jgi:predicted transcriptional regulator
MPREKKSPPPAVVLTARISQDVKAGLDKAAREDARTTSSLVAKILMDWLDSRKKRPAK